MKSVCYNNFMDKKVKRCMEIYEILSKYIVNPKSELKYSNEYELLIAVMLSAQCTDKRVNIITEKLFKKYPTVYDLASAKLEEVEEYIKSCNYYHTKAKNILNASKMIVEKFDGIVPSDHNDLMSLPGVGNKTANVVQAVAFSRQALPVDTHILRVGNRLEFVSTKNPTECERVLKELFSGCDFVKLHHLLLLFGRYTCKAKNPSCDDCVLKKICNHRGN